HRNTSVMFGAGAANLLQLAHPWVSQAIDQHSKTQSDPFGRLRRTFLNVHSMVFGNLDQVLDSAVKVHNIHASITGKVSESTGRTAKGSEYLANQVGAMLWVHATLWITGLQVYELFNTPLTRQERDQYYNESKMFAYLFGIPDSALPENWEDFLAYFNSVVNSDQLSVGDVGRQLVGYIFSMRPYLMPLLNRHKIHTAILLPDRLRAEFGFPEVTTEMRKKFDFDVKLIGSVMRYAPEHVKYLPPYLEAMKRIQGAHADIVTRLTNRVIYGQPTLVS
ncbi:MAG TPA: oxygenase MpaB family protein, partial [Pseudomonadales bacterium]|nr:oxygenase MpaB family protein [Pseudomonadales bacterium]